MVLVVRCDDEVALVEADANLSLEVPEFRAYVSELLTGPGVTSAVYLTTENELTGTLLSPGCASLDDRADLVELATNTLLESVEAPYAPAPEGLEDPGDLWRCPHLLRLIHGQGLTAPHELDPRWQRILFPVRPDHRVAEERAAAARWAAPTASTGSPTAPRTPSAAGAPRPWPPAPPSPCSTTTPTAASTRSSPSSRTCPAPRCGTTPGHRRPARTHPRPAQPALPALPPRPAPPAPAAPARGRRRRLPGAGPPRRYHRYGPWDYVRFRRAGFPSPPAPPARSLSTRSTGAPTSRTSSTGAATSSPPSAGRPSRTPEGRLQACLRHPAAQQRPRGEARPPALRAGGGGPDPGGFVLPRYGLPGDAAG